MTSYNELQKEREENAAKLVMNTFYKIDNKDGVTASEITKYLQDKFGDVWRASNLTDKAEDTLKRSAALGFLERRGERYIANLARGLCSWRRRRRRCCRRKRKRRCSRRRRRRRKGGCKCG
ncbi:uncharacterized protein LOC133319916 [Danaus plexippus]|uniref:Uncharacterized protein n=1 Tax=Danaus plexippus plexippus TaxID=278856 RepID=A0A212EKG7_DANPL|nr:uncharacterized protein LOC133319916 [Danaus plexippus]OWR41974.1 hypothetical protein KGM_203022 [Danaus plexippus plexippus]